MAHTPGPWRLISADDEYTIHAPGHGTIIATIHPLMPERPDNARLIAAAPALLAALEGLLDHIEQLKRGHSPALLSLDRIPDARAAIEATKGEAK